MKDAVEYAGACLLQIMNVSNLLKLSGASKQIFSTHLILAAQMWASLYTYCPVTVVQSDLYGEMAVKQCTQKHDQ